MATNPSPPKRTRQRKRKLPVENEASTPRCQSLLELQDQFQQHWEVNKTALIPESLNVTLALGEMAIIAVTDSTDDTREAFGIPPVNQPGSIQPLIQIDVSAAVLPVSDADIKKKQQRAVCREILKAIQAVDGYHYTLKGSQDTQGGNGFRFKYVCVDSFENTDRAPNRSRKEAAIKDQITQSPKISKSGKKAKSRPLDEGSTRACMCQSSAETDN
jgi:hypothetical protein